MFIDNKTIVAIPNFSENDTNSFKNVLIKNEKKRDWFPKDAYRCLPLTIGNQYGFSIVPEYDFSFVWDGQDGPDAIKFKFYENQESLENKLPILSSHFGSGIITVNLPFHFKTGDGINLMTINPPNHVIPNVTVMTGVVETDNLVRDFSFNLKVQMSNIEVTVKSGTPIASFIPIPRYFVDNFEVIEAKDIMTKEEIGKEIELNLMYKENRKKLLADNIYYDKLYLNGLNIDGEKFKDHQKVVD